MNGIVHMLQIEKMRLFNLSDPHLLHNIYDSGVLLLACSNRACRQLFLYLGIVSIFSRPIKQYYEIVCSTKQLF